jgi:hypothetical protein
MGAHIETNAVLIGGAQSARLGAEFAEASAGDGGVSVAAAANVPLERLFAGDFGQRSGRPAVVAQDRFEPVLGLNEPQSENRPLFALGEDVRDAQIVAMDRDPLGESERRREQQQEEGDAPGDAGAKFHKDCDSRPGEGRSREWAPWSARALIVSAVNEFDPPLSWVYPACESIDESRLRFSLTLLLPRLLPIVLVLVIVIVILIAPVRTIGIGITIARTITITSEMRSRTRGGSEIERDRFEAME